MGAHYLKLPFFIMNYHLLFCSPKPLSLVHINLPVVTSTAQVRKPFSLFHNRSIKLGEHPLAA